MNLVSVMDELGTALEAIPGLRVFPYYADRLVPPAAVVGWPEPLTYDGAMVRGMDRLQLPVLVTVGKADARSSRDTLAAYLDGAGSGSVKAALDGGTYTACHTVRVMSVTVQTITSAGVDLLGAEFTVDITGSGSS